MTPRPRAATSSASGDTEGDNDQVARGDTAATKTPSRDRGTTPEQIRQHLSEPTTSEHQNIGCSAHNGTSAEAFSSQKPRQGGTVTQALQPILYSYDGEQEAVWVDATPFRAHRRTAAGDRSDRAGPRPADRGERAGGGAPRPRTAGPTGASHLRRHRPPVAADHHPGGQGAPVPTGAGAGSRDTGCARWPKPAGPSSCSPSDIGVCISDVQQVLGRGSATCSQLTALKIAAAYEQWETEQEFPRRSTRPWP